MCSIQEDDTPQKKEKIFKTLNRKCMKCKEEPAVLIARVDDAFCRGCFQVYVTHKFRAAIGKTKLVRDRERVLVALSGGPSSCALLHLIREGLSQRAHKKLRFKPGLIFIDEGQSVGQSPEERRASLTRVHALLYQSGFPFHVCTLADCLNTERLKILRTQQMNHVEATETSKCANDLNIKRTENDENTLTSASEDQEQLLKTNTAGHAGDKAVDTDNVDPKSAEVCSDILEINTESEKQLSAQLGSIRSLSAREDFIRALRHRILLEVARHHGYSKVMLGNAASQLAVRLLTDISTGRGIHAAMETGFADRRNTDVMFLRPLRDFSSKEIAMYNNIHRLESVFIPSLTTMGDAGASIEHLTESFVTGLQSEYPSTVSNIMRTGEKLETFSAVTIEDHCALCQGPLDTDVGSSSALAALHFSQEISSDGKGKGNLQCGNGENSDSRLECCGEGNRSCRSSSQPSVPDQALVLQNLCYGCRIVAMEMDDVKSLPDFVLKDVSWRNRRSAMKAEIQDFLLEDR